MRILLTSQVFPPEIHPTAVMVNQLAEYLTERGHQVVVACGYPHHPVGRVFAGYSRLPIRLERRGAIQVVRAWHFVSPDARPWVRGLVMASQALAIAAAAAWAGRVEVVVNFGPPLAGPLLSWLVALRSGAPLVSVVYDIYPDAAIRTGRITNPALLWLARLTEHLSYRVASRILVLARGFQDQLLQKGVPGSKLSVFPVWLDSTEVRPLPRVNAWRSELGIDENVLVVLYAGTIGIVSGAEIIVDVATMLAHRTNVLFLLVGEGQLKGRLEALVTARHLPNVRFLPFQERERLSEVQATSDVSVVTLSEGNGYSSVPSKVVAYMAAGRAVVASVDEDCDTARAVRAAGCGTVVPPSDSSAMAEAIVGLLDDPSERDRAGRAGRQAFEQCYAANALLPRYADLLEAVAGRAGR